MYSYFIKNKSLILLKNTNTKPYLIAKTMDRSKLLIMHQNELNFDQLLIAE